jgi:hypothetical protein
MMAGHLRSLRYKLRHLDMDQDGIISEQEIANSKELLEISLREEKAEAQKRLSWIAMISMLLFTIFLLLPIIPDSRVEAISDLIGLFYIAQASIIGFYFGATAYMSRT